MPGLLSIRIGTEHFLEGTAVTKETATKTLRLDGELTIYCAAELKAQLMEAWGGDAPLEVDLSGITEVDGAGLQLLILAKREALRSGKSVRFVGHSPAVLEVIDLANLSGQFGDPLVLAAH